MKSRLQAASTFLLIALVLSFVPAAAYPSSASAAQACTDRAQFVADVTVPDGTVFDPGAAFKKTWRLKNVGTCIWLASSYKLSFVSGERLGANTEIGFSSDVMSGQTVDLSVDMTAPNTAGHYIGYWKIKGASGVLFGIGINANKSWWVEINVRGSTPTGVALDFTAKASDATWSSGAGGLSFPGKDGDAKGFALKLDKPKFESGVVASQPGLLFSPQQITNGFIQAVYPDFAVQSGDRFQTTVGCEFNATSCFVAYRLDYQVGTTIRTFWSFRERYEGLTFSPNLDLTPLAGQTVKFILYISAAGSPVGDRALWGNPVIVRKGGAPPPPPTPQTPPPTAQTVPPSSCDKAQFVADVTVPDGTVMAPGQTFRKTWSIKNVGNCPWTKSYQLVFFSGERMGGPTSASFAETVAVGTTFKFSVDLTAPSAAGSYRGFWMFKNANGALFGIGAQGNKPWWVDIKVSGSAVTPGGPTATPTPTATGGSPVTPSAGTAYDFATNACAATWYSRAGKLNCPGTDGDAKGFVLKVTNPKLETGATDPRPGLITFPSAPATRPGPDGYIQGFFPPFKVQNGDHFQSRINCEGGATLCYVAFRLDYQTGTGPITTISGPWLERYDTPPQFRDIDVDLSSLAGKDVKFILTVLSAGTNVGDRALWVGPIISRAGATQQQSTATATGTATATTAVGTATATPTATATGMPTATSTPTPTPTTSSSASTYQDTKYNFKFTLPSGASIVNQSDTAGRVDLPIITAGTNLLEKYIQINVAEGKNPCVSPAVGGEQPASTENVTINSIPFVKTTGQGAAAGNRYDWTVYATTSNNACITLAFILHSANPDNYPVPPPEYNKAAESAVFGTTMATYNKIS